MRKFRVWCKDRNEWESHSTCLRSDGQLLHLDNGRIMPLGKDNHVVEFYTGLHDSKRTAEYPEGQPIYEGDVVRRTCDLVGAEDDGFIGIVKYQCAAFYLESLDGKDGRYLWDDVQELEVICNIHDNPELIAG